MSTTDKKTLIVNLFAGPGCGKSTTAAQVFSELKVMGIECEMALEYAKEKVWEKAAYTMDDQIYIFAKQYHHIWRLCGQVDVVITDSPLPFSVMYDCEHRQKFADFVMDEFSRFNNMNFLITRSTTYVNAGRQQSEEEAKELDDTIKNILDSNNIKYQVVTKENAKIQITNEILKYLNK